jgi:hypothetical protein
LGTNRDGVDDQRLPRFRLRTAAQRAPVFQEAFGPDIIRVMCAPVQQVVDVTPTFEIDHWKTQYQTMFLSIAETMWGTCDWDKFAITNMPDFDHFLLYANVRDAVEQNFVGRPPIMDIPVREDVPQSVYDIVRTRRDPTNLPSIIQPLNAAAWADDAW